jgi:hypothetical protein
VRGVELFTSGQDFIPYGSSLESLASIKKRPSAELTSFFKQNRPWGKELFSGWIE